MTDKGITELCSYILLSWMKDYKDALARNDKGKIQKYEKEITEGLAGEICETILMIDGEVLVDECRKEVERKYDRKAVYAQNKSYKKKNKALTGTDRERLQFGFWSNSHKI